MPRLLDQVRLGIPDDVLLEQIQRDTAGEWSGISSAAFEKFGQFVVGVHGGRIASMYDITGYGPGEEAGRIRFDVTPAYGFEDLIGQPVPGGAWKRGEARPVRYVDTSAFLQHFHERGLLDGGASPEDEIERKIVEFVRAEAAVDAGMPSAAASGAALLADVEVAPDTRGGIRVTVPMGTRVTIVQRTS
ncbi:hypothetical protein ISU07_06590 [Nocardioides islandensis]|uniref:Uncharacterized protein n=1 Tax=Nocardioides islandensis TaxID=433663 RepID=A0A930V8D7_9ACTN|nr:hypothetical protein [Nocardioides islandensis]MBF4762789.1 hypothetical protein [Nocardioides islandensis]